MLPSVPAGDRAVHRGSHKGEELPWGREVLPLKEERREGEQLDSNGVVNPANGVRPSAVARP